MTPWVLVACSLAGGLGAALRYTLDALAARRWGPGYPRGTFVINALGSLLLGATLGASLSPGLTLVVGTGLLGGFTTFSTAMWEALTLLRERHWGAALVHTLGMAVVCGVAGAAGLALGGLTHP